MKICAIGDPHGNLNKIKKIPLKNVGLILLTGDIGNADLARKMAFTNIERKNKGLDEILYSKKDEKKAYMQSYESAIKLVKYLVKFAPVYLISGNVESPDKDTIKQSKEIGLKLPLLFKDLSKIRNIFVINNKLVTINHVRILGLKYFIDTSWVREFKPSNYKDKLKYAVKETEKVKKILTRFKHVDVLLTHQPPYGVMDKVTSKFAPKEWRNKHAGSKTILNYIIKQKPKYVFSGHIHEMEGTKKIGITQVYNLGVCGYKTIDI
ncbi:Calcineurin-like phosphoesterase [Candidatus Tiddalikarchaeum anstoanum]|nr:Calcineurin-like phosphoesterase [Candidatus Tiddalikarchaeum anstoanum]